MIMAATSSATAAFRSRRVPTNEKEHYETNYDQISSFEYDGNIEMDTPTIKLSSTLSNAAKLRIGCPHEKTENRIAERLKKVWNLCETDWQAVFVPQYYTAESWIGRRSVSLSCDSVADVNADIYYFPYPPDPDDPYSNIMCRLDDLLPLYGGTAPESFYQIENLKYYLLKYKRQ